MIDENALVLPVNKINYLFRHGAFKVIPIAELQQLINNNGRFVARDKAESDESIRQIIPYVIMQNANDLYLIVKRLSTQTEQRLHGMYSIGLGGHINDQDTGDTPWMKFLSGMEREMNEEVIIKKVLEAPKYVGVIMDSSTPVNKVHLGIVYLLKADIEGMNEKDKFSWDFLTFEQLLKYYDEMEVWSKYVMTNIL
ncbi:MAG: hypothetical protein QXV17_07430 [Candidatus Micrarchaeaceae archaeon]